MQNSFPLRLTRIRVYPLKGAAGFDLEESEVGVRGIPGDRRWMLVRPNGDFLSQRTHPRLCLIRVSPSGQESEGKARYSVDAPGMNGLDLAPFESEEWIQVQLHQDRFSTVVGNAEADRWFTDFLGDSCRLAYFPDRLTRPVDPEYAKGHTVGFADGYPVHLASQDSLRDLNQRLSRSTTMLRFRPNLVVEGGVPWEEDEWRTVAIENVILHLVKPCARCSVTTVDQGTGTRGREPLRTLRGFREAGGKVYFGQNAVVGQTGRFRVGSNVHIVGKGDPRPGLSPGARQA